MSIYISWPVEIDAAFRPAYAEVVQELIQDTPLNNSTHYMVGSSRITPEHIAILSAAFPTVAFTEEDPQWVIGAFPYV